MTDQSIIPFNKPFMVGNELENIRKAIEWGHLSGGGHFSKATRDFFRTNFGVKKAFLTNSCTDALEMVALLLNIKEGDEIIAPSFAFVSTVNPFVMRGAKIVFADSCADHPNINVDTLQGLITPRTKAIVCVHYSGMACDMDKLLEICSKNKIHLIEDAAHAIDATWNGSKYLGTIGTFGTFSFHETKNIISGEGGMLCVNDERFIERAEIILEKGTNRPAFFRGETSKYEWVDIGSSFQASELTAAFLMAQLLEKEKIRMKRVLLWNLYRYNLADLAAKGCFSLPVIPEKASNNGHIFYLLMNSETERNNLIRMLANNKIHAVFHYQSLHNSAYYKTKHDDRELPNADRFSSGLVRLPMFYGLKEEDVNKISELIHNYFIS